MPHYKKSKKNSTNSNSIIPNYDIKTGKCYKKKIVNYKANSCDCELNYYFPLPNLPTQPLTERVTPLSWFTPGSVQSCCSICSTVKPVYVNPCNTCSYNKGAYPINNTSYYNTYEYI